MRLPAIYGKARAWLAKCYVEEGWNYDAEDVIRETKRDSIHWAAQKEWDYTLTDYYLRTADYKNAAVYLRRVIRHEIQRTHSHDRSDVGHAVEQDDCPTQAHGGFR